MAVHALPSSAVDAGPLAGAQNVTLTVYLQPSADRGSALDSFLTAVQTPGTPEYHQWLTPAKFAQSFGATDEQIAAVQAWAGQQGLAVSAVSGSKTSMTVTGTAAQVETALAPRLHAIQVNGQVYAANTAVPTVPDALAANVMAIDGLSTVPAVLTATVRTETARVAADDLLASMDAVVESNSSRLLSIASTACVEDVDAATAAAMHLLLKQAAAQGTTTLAASGCNGRGSASFPGSLAEVLAVATAPGITPANATVLTESQPVWQSALGLPEDGFRHEPDLTVSSLAGLENTVMTILAKQPVPADGSAARLGNIGGKLYTMVTVPGLYTQPDGTASGTWEAATGLGLTNLDKLADAFPSGTTGVTVTILPANGVFSTTYGTAVNYNITVYGTAAATPTGTITISFAPGGYTTTAPITLTNGQASFNLSQLNGLPAANTTTYTVTATYNGDTTFATGTGSTKLYVNPQPLTINASTVGTPQVGGTYTVNVAIAATAGTPTGTVTISPANTTAKTLNFTGTNSQATVSADFTATRQGSIYIPITCTVDSNYTCDGTNTTVYAVQGTSTTTVQISPNPVQAGQTTTLTATVTGSGGVAPSGQVAFTDANNTALCTTPYSGAISGSVSCTASNLTGTSGTVTGTYSGDTNYATSKGTAQYTAAAITTKVTLQTISSPIVVNTPITLTSDISPANTVNNQPPTGTITFYDGTTQIAQKTIGNYQYSASAQVTLGTPGTHPIYSKYSGDANYGGGTSDTQTVTVGPATSVTLTASPTGDVVYGNNIALTAQITGTPNNGGTTLAGSITFNVNGSDFTTQTVPLTNATATSATATITITKALAVGTYTVNLYCVNGNYDCGNLNTNGFSFRIVKATTVTTLQLSQTAPFTAGSSLTAVAKVSPAAAATGSNGTITGTVDFYDNANKVASVGIDPSTEQAGATFNVAGANDNIVAVYNGDGNNLDSKSSGSGTGIGATVSTTTAVSANPLTALNSAVVALTANVVAVPAGGSTTVGSPTGTVFFYDTVNGTQFLLGSAALGSSGVNASAAVLNTTGLKDGANSISAAFQGSTGFLTSSSTVSVVVQITDYALAFTPTSLNLNAGQAGKVTVAVNAVNGFTGKVNLGCTPPSGAAITCSFDNATINTSGVATLTIATTVRSAALHSERVVEAVVGAAGALLLCLLLPVARRRRMQMLAVAALAVLGSTLGCTHLSNAATGSGLGSGTPAGTDVITVTAQGTDATGATVRHTYTITVNVQ